VAPRRAERLLALETGQAAWLGTAKGRCEHARVPNNQGDRDTVVEANGGVILARLVFGLTLALIAAGIVFSRLDTGVNASTDFGFVFAFSMFPIVGYVLSSRRSDNPLSWLMAGIGVALGLDALLGSYGSYAIHGGVGGGTDLGAIALVVDGVMWVPIVALPATFLILLFPSGHLPSPRWRWFARILGSGFVLFFVAAVFSPGSLADSGYPNVQNPLGLQTLGPFLQVALVFVAIIPVGIVASLVSLVQRYRRSSGVERLQLRWLVTAATIVGVLYGSVLPISLVGGWSDSTAGWLQVLQSAAIVSFGLIPIAIGVSILRYRLFEIDVVVNRALLFAALAVFITAVYLAIVIGVGAVVGSRSNTVLSAVAAAVVALAFQPARRRAQRLADRLVYGKRATPYEVLSEFSERLGNVYANDELLPRMARALAEGTGAARADVWVRAGDVFRSDASWPADAEPATDITAAEAEGSMTSSSMIEPVRHRGALLGALSIRKRPGESITVTEERLVRDLATQAGLVMRNVTLTEQLLDNIEQLRASRQRLVAAQDEERRKLERNLHDGAQQQIVALTVKLRLLGQLVDRDAEQAKSMAAQLQSDATDALEELRDLARGIYPPLLADQGLVAALQSQARKSVVPVAIEADGVGRYSRETEAAVYFSCLEALQNVAKYANASLVTLRLSDGDHRLTFEVTDDGVGFDERQTSFGTGLQGITDRLSAVGGDVVVRSTPGAGTSVTGHLPVADEPRVS
jgi:signal transduction histidine kinase